MNEVIVAPGPDGATTTRSGEIEGTLAFADLLADGDAELWPRAAGPFGDRGLPVAPPAW